MIEIALAGLVLVFSAVILGMKIPFSKLMGKEGNIWGQGLKRDRGKTYRKV